MARVLVQTDRHVDPRAWSERHRAGELPDGLPYGLDRLARWEHDVAHRPALPPRAAIPARALRGVGHRWDWWGARAIATGADVDVNLCWDERSGIPTGTFTGTRSPALVTGVIWLTDGVGPAQPYRAAATNAFRRAAAVWALSSAQLPVLHDRFGVPPRRAHRLGFGVDADFWSAERAATRRPGVDGPPRVLTVGNDRDRDHDLVVEAMAPAARRGVLTLDLITGQPIDVPPDVGRRHASLSHAELRDAYAATDVVALALRDNLHVSGMTTVLEAQAMGRPVVCSRTPGMTDYVVDGVTGVLTPVGDVEAFRRAVVDLAQDPDRAREMGRQGRQFVVDRATTDTQAAALAEILRSV